MKSKLYRKFRIGKHRFPTRQIRGTGNTKGKNVPGHIAARDFLAKKFGEDLTNATIEKNRFQWVFRVPR